jgi:hypothetical protein
MRGEGNNVSYGRLVTLLTSQPSTTNARFQCYPFSHFYALPTPGAGTGSSI